MLLDILRDTLRFIDVAILWYFLAVNTTYLILILLAAMEFAHHIRRRPLSGFEETYRSPLTQPVSVLVPAYNEEAGIVNAVQAMLALRYPLFEVVVVDDGSTDRTFDRLRDEFELVEVPRVIPDDVVYRGDVLGVYIPSQRPDPLVVVRKVNGGKSDALAVAVNVAQHPLVCMVDADSILDPQALLSVTKPFADDPLRVVASGGMVRVANGCTVVAGRIADVRMPRRWLPRIQVIEYLRAFMLGRTGWSRLGGLLVISGAFGMFRRDVVVASGGIEHDAIGEDAELVVRLHRLMKARHHEYRIVFVAEPVSWTEVPSSWRDLGKQRRRWHRGITEIVMRHRRMLFNPRYGRVGLFVLPYYLLFEVIAPAIELAGLILVPLGLLVGVVSVKFMLLFLVAAYGYALVLNLVALTIEEYTFHRYGRWRDLVVSMVAALLENFGYRQFTAYWRVRGAWDAVRGRRRVWGEMTREGFGPRDEASKTRTASGIR